MQANYVQRLRVTFRKVGATRWIGHLDVSRTWERALNRAAIPMAYTQGFNRRPRMQFASALPLGYTSACELVDLWLATEIDPAQALAQLQTCMAPGIEVTAAKTVDIKEAALPTLTVASRFVVRFNHVDVDADLLAVRVSEMLAAETVLIEKPGRKNRGKLYNLRPRIMSMRVIAGQPVEMEMVLSAAEGQAGRPNDIVAALGIDPLATHIHRTDLTLRDETVTSAEKPLS
jgi:radical SAM-linked protein